MKFEIHTFGCKVNTYDSSLMERKLKNLSLSHQDQNEKSSLVHVINTCAVTREASLESLRVIRRLKSKNPFSTVVVTGCAAQVDTELYRDLPGADLVIANSHKHHLPEILEKYFKGEIKERVFHSNIFKKEDLEQGGGEKQSHTRTFLKIQDGCNSFCTYCVIPFSRGKSRSLPIHHLIERVNEFESQGVQEVVLTGVHIGDYEDPINQGRLEDLVEALLQKTRLPRFRLTSLEPVEVSERLLDFYVDDRLCPHFHMSIQSAQDHVLKGMKRNYGQKEVIQSLETIARRVPGAFIGMDVIVGFPTETEDFFLETVKVLEDSPWTRLHVFPYSERPGTYAARMPVSIPLSERHQRSQVLRQLSQIRYLQTMQRQKNDLKKTLILKKPSKGCLGLSRDYWRIKVDVPDSLLGKEVLVRMTGIEPPSLKNSEGCLLGQVEEEHASI